MVDKHSLVHGIPHVYQFEQNRSKYRCQAAIMAALSAFARPNHWPNLSLLMSEIYTKYVPGGDNPNNTKGMQKEHATDWFKTNGINYHDLQALIGNDEELRLETTAMINSGIPVMLGIDDESQLYLGVVDAQGNTVRGKKLHDWNDTGLGHAFARIGVDFDHPLGLYNDPATSSPPFPYPTPIRWADVAASRINTAIGVMPPGVAAPPADFRFHRDGQDFKWPVPPPVLNAEAALATIEALRAADEQAYAALQAAYQQYEQKHQAGVAAYAQVITDLGGKP